MFALSFPSTQPVQCGYVGSRPWEEQGIFGVPFCGYAGWLYTFSPTVLNFLYVPRSQSELTLLMSRKQHSQYCFQKPLQEQLTMGASVALTVWFPVEEPGQRGGL